MTFLSFLARFLEPDHKANSDNYDQGCHMTEPYDVIDWNVSSDSANIIPTAIELDSALHESFLKECKDPVAWLNSDLTHWRKSILEKFEILLGRAIFGSVLEIGAGTGWCSGVLSRRASVKEVFALDYDPVSVNALMPFIHDCIGADKKKIRRVIGSFNKIPLEEHFDLIVAMGALHHSKALPTTFVECFKALKPGGHLLASDMCEPDFAQQHELRFKKQAKAAELSAKYRRTVSCDGLQDHFYRLCQYLSSAYEAGFDVLPYLFDDKYGQFATNSIFKQPRNFVGYRVVSYYPYFAEGRYDRLLLICQKPQVDGCSTTVRTTPARARRLVPMWFWLQEELKRLNRRLKRLPCYIRRRLIS